MDLPEIRHGFLFLFLWSLIIHKLYIISALRIDDYLMKIIVSKIDPSSFMQLFAGYNNVNVKLLTLHSKAVKLCVLRSFICFMAILSVPKSIQKF